MTISPKTVDEQATFFQDHGYVIVDNAVAPDYLVQLQEATARFLADPQYPKGTVRNLLAIDDVFEGLIDGHAGMGVLDALMPDLQLLAVDLRTCPPGGGNMAWHMDGALWSHEILTVNTALYLDDLTPENGALRIVPRSHRSPLHLAADESFAAIPGEVVVTCPAGTMVVFDDCLWHRTGENGTDKPRRGIFTYYGRFWVKPTSYAERPEPFWKMTRFLDGKDERRRQLLGLYRKGSEFNHHQWYEAGGDP